MVMTPPQTREHPDARHERGVARRLTLRALVLIAAVSVSLAAAAPPAPALEKGLSDVRLERTTDAAKQAVLIKEIGPRLKTRWVRLLVDWAALESVRGTYSPAKVAQL